MRRFAGMYVLAASLSSAGCVVESVTPVRPVPDPQAASTRPSNGDSPDGPRRSDSPGGASGRARISFVPLGLLEYDGQTLPLAAPGGTFVASQTGRPAEWGTLTAEPGSAPAYSARGIVRAVLNGKFATPVAMPPGLLLGRSADSDGFLVESPREDGARWIGRVSWREPSEVTWLVNDDEVNAFAIAPAPDWVIFCVREKNAPLFSLVELRAGQRRVLAQAADCSFQFPAISADRSTIGVVRRSARGTELVVLSAAAAPGPARTLDAVLLSPSPDTGVAWSVFGSVDPCPPALQSSGDAQSGTAFAFYHPGQRTCAVYDQASARLLLLDEGSIAAAIWSDERGTRCALAAKPKQTLLLDLVSVPTIRFAPRTTIASRSLVPRGSPAVGSGVLVVGEPGVGGSGMLEAAIVRVE